MGGNSEKSQLNRSAESTKELMARISKAADSRIGLDKDLLKLQYSIIFAKRNLAKKYTEELVGPKNVFRPSSSAAHRTDRAVMSDAQTELKKLTKKKAALMRKISDADKKLNHLLLDLEQISPADATKLIDSQYPILLFPVRLETKFNIRSSSENVQNELLIRIYPDEIAIQTHEQYLTEGEIESGKNYCTNIWYAGKANDQAKRTEWGIVCSKHGSYRSAWIVEKIGKALLNKDEWPTEETPFDSLPKPMFGEIESKPYSWTLTPSTHIMPDRWVAITYDDDNKETHREVGKPVKPIISVGLNPMSTSDPDIGIPTDPDADIGTEGNLEINESMRWMVDFSTAEKEGMGIRIRLSEQETQRGFSRLIVVGLKYSSDYEKSTQLLEDLFTNHHYTNGISFVAQGTATNNTEYKKSGFSSRDDWSKSYDIELSDIYTPSMEVHNARDGELAARAFGLDPGYFSHIENSNLTDQLDAKHMGIALWPSTMGYFLEEMMHPIFNIEDIRLGRKFFMSNVRARGPLPVFRIGKTPYGILPSSSLARWNSIQEDDGKKIESVLPGFLNAMVPMWKAKIPQAPRIGKSKDPDSELLNVLGMDANSLEFRARDAIGQEYLENLFGLLWPSFNFGTWWNAHRALAGFILNQIGHPEWNPRLLSMTFGEDYNLRLNTVKSGPLSEVRPLDDEKNYIKWLSNSSIYEIRKRERLFPDEPNPLLYLLLRHSILREYVSTSFKILVKAEMMSLAMTKEPELVGMRPDSNEKNTVYSGLDKVVPELSQETLSTYLHKSTAVRKGTSIGMDRNRKPPKEDLIELADLRTSLDYLSNVPTAKLEQLMSETLDLFSHRLDGWVTALFTDRLQKKRLSAKRGIYLGGYGWLEGLKPAVRSKQLAESSDIPKYIKDAVTNVKVTDKPVSKPVIIQNNAGFIQAPSLTQATAAAVLRNAYLSRTSDRERYRINLSSERVRRSLWLLDGIREGQPLGALLGYRFERGLHENHPGLELDQYIQPLRELFPLASADLFQQGGPQERIEPRNIVDGLTMLMSWRSNSFPFEKLNMADPAVRQAVSEELKSLNEIADGLGDLVLAESVFQMVQGNYAGLAANLEAYSSGDRPPEPQIAKTPRSGIRATYRMLLLFFGSRSLQATWNDSKDNPRAKAEPNLNAWIGTLLGDPSKIVCKAKYKNPDDSTTIVPVTLADLRLCPLDFLEFSISNAEQQQSELDIRIAYHVLNGDPTRVDLEVTYGVPREDLQTGVISFADALEFARRLNKLIINAAECFPEHIVLPEEGNLAMGQSNLSTMITDLRNRITFVEDNLILPAIDALNSASGSDPLVANDLTESLLRASLFGLPSALPKPRTATMPEQDYLNNLKEKAIFAKSQLEKKHTGARQIGHDLTAPINTQLATCLTRVRELLGQSFKMLPSFKIENPNSFNSSLANFGTLLNGGGNKEIIKWFQRAAKVRPGLARYEDAISFAEALGTTKLDLRVAQLPFLNNEKWIALKFDDNSPKASRLSVVFAPVGTVDFADSISGLSIDSWVEVIPSREETMGVAFHYDGPSSEAPQSLILAVSPKSDKAWDFEDVVATVNETLDLAKIRAVDRDLLGEFAQFLPALFFTGSVKSSDGGGKPVGDLAINTDFAFASSQEIPRGEEL